ncbi:PHD-finger, partial [Ostertagia ostertagi]
MTPAAPPLETLLPKARFRNIHRIPGTTAPPIVNDIKKTPKMKFESRRSMQSLCQGTESCEEEDDHSPRRAHSFPRLDNSGGTPSTSGKCLGDSHIEVSDEDRDFGSSRRENVKKTAVGSKGSRDLRTDQRYLKEEWRAEWSNGIQIPLRANNPNPAEVRKAVVKRISTKLSRVLQKRRELIKGFFDNAYEPIETTPLRLYECNVLDELWVKLFNEHRMHSKSPSLPMEVFLDIMNEFEIECYKNIHRKLLEPLHSPSSRIEDGDDEAACDICLAIDSEPDDEMVFCDGCNLCVHMSCYGLQELPPDEWLCMKCRLCYGRNPSCLLCPTIGGALKCTDTNQWAHVVCALWIPECRVDFEKREPIIRINEIKEERWSAKLELDPLLVADVFAYWVKKRLHLNNGKPLIENLQDEITAELTWYHLNTNSHVLRRLHIKRKRGRPRKNPVENEAPSTPEAKVLDAKTLHAKERLERSLWENGCLICDCGRSREQRNFLHAHIGALLLITEHLSRPVPLSHRTDRFLNETLPGNLCSKDVIEEGVRRADEICGLNGLVMPKASSFSRRNDRISPSETTPASTSSSESYHPPCLRNSSPVMRNSTADIPPVSSPKSISRRSLSSPRKYPRKRTSKQSRIFFDEEQRNNRRKSLRSSDAKPTDVEDHSRTHDPNDGSISGKHDESSLLLRDSNHHNEKAVEVTPAEGDTTSKRNEEGDTSISHDPPVKMTQSSSKGSGRKSRTGRKSDTKSTVGGAQSPSPKRHRGAHALGTELRLLKSLNLKNANKDFKN